MKITSPTRSAHALVFALTALLASGASQAQDTDSKETEGSKWGVGLIGIYKERPYRDFDNKAEAWPLVTYENKWVRVFGPGLDVKLGKTGSVSYALTASYIKEGYSSDDSQFLTGMNDRKASIWAGGRVTWNNEIANLSASWQGDASGNSKGQRFSLGAERRFTFGDWGVSPRLVATWLDKKYVEYYYGVASSEVRADRAFYEGSSTVNTEIGVRMDYRLAPQHTLLLDVGTTLLGSGIKDSPLVNRSSVPDVRLGYLYRF